MAQPSERPDKPPRPCPICGKMSVQAYHPFCSKRCADVDLQRWFTGGYVLPDSGGDVPTDDPEED